MTSVKHILIAIDGSELSIKAAAYGGDLARALGATVSIVMVNDEQMVIPEAWGTTGLPGTEGFGSISTEDIRQDIERRTLDDALAKAADAAGKLDKAPETVALWGHVADKICDYAKAHDVDLIVIGSHGRSGIRRAILGSVSHAVANQAPCAVTIVR